MGCLLWVQPQIDILPHFPQWCVQYHVILDCIITAFDGIVHIDSIINFDFLFSFQMAVSTSATSWHYWLIRSLLITQEWIFFIDWSAASDNGGFHLERKTSQVVITLYICDIIILNRTAMAGHMLSKLLHHLLHKHYIFFILMYLYLVKESSAQNHFPQLFNVARHKTITTVPSQSTCGVTATSAFCTSSTTFDYITTCIPNFCAQACPWRTQLPAGTNLMDGLGYGMCVVPDNMILRPNSHSSMVSIRFLLGSNCFYAPRAPIALGLDNSMTLTFWMWQERNNEG